MTSIAKVIVGVLVVFMVCIGVGIAPAAAKEGNYGAVKLGTFMPADDLEDYDTGPYLELVFGHRYNPNFALEGSVAATVVQSPGGYDYEIYPFTVNAKFIHPVDNLELYGMFGLGIYRVYSEFRDDSDEIFGWNIGFGALNKLNDNMGLGLELKYAFIDETGWGVEIEGLTIAANLQFNF